MGQIADYLRMWSQEINQIGFSYVFDAIDFGVIDQLEVMAAANDPLATPLIANIEAASQLIRSEFDYPNLMTVYDAYVEAKVGKKLLDCGLAPVRLPETAVPTPDFRVPFQGSDFFVEVKALHVRRGNANYAAIMEAGFESLHHLFQQRGRNEAFAISEMLIQSHNTATASYDPSSTKFLAEELLGRVDGRLKAAQFQSGPTFAAVDFTLLPVMGTLANSICRTYPEPQSRSAVSGVLWNVAFGQEGSDLFRPIEFDGLSNLDGQFEGSGLLIGSSFVKGFIFFNRTEIASLIRKQDQGQCLPFLSQLSNVWNNEVNEILCSFHDVQELADFRQMIRIKAVELWKERGEPLWEERIDWNQARADLGIPACALF